MQSHEARRAAQSLRAMCSAGLCACLLACLPCCDLHAEAAAVQGKAVSADALLQLGRRLRAEIDAAYAQMKESKTLSNIVRQGNDVTPIVLKYIPVGIAFDDAKAILRSAGCVIPPLEQGHVFGRSAMKDGMLEVKHTFAVELTPRTPGDFSVVGAVRGTIFTKYVVHDRK